MTITFFFISLWYKNATMGHQIETFLGAIVNLACLAVNLNANGIKIRCELSPLY